MHLKAVTVWPGSAHRTGDALRLRSCWSMLPDDVWGCSFFVSNKGFESQSLVNNIPCVFIKFILQMSKPKEPDLWSRLKHLQNVILCYILIN